jgi:hypothetical protein
MYTCTQHLISLFEQTEQILLSARRQREQNAISSQNNLKMKIQLHNLKPSKPFREEKKNIKNNTMILQQISGVSSCSLMSNVLLS